MEYQEIFEKLKDRALSFHKVLSENNVYIRDLSESEFFQLVNSRIESTAKSLHVKQGTPWLTLFTFPSYLLFDLEDFVYQQSWDTEEGIDVLFEEFKELFDRTPFRFSWNFDEEKKVLNFRIGDLRRSCKCQSFEDLHYGYFKGGMIEALDYVESNITSYLNKNNWYLYSIATIDQIAEYLLIPINAVNPIRKFLIPIDNDLPDERTSWMYKGLPDEKKNIDIWNL